MAPAVGVHVNAVILVVVLGAVVLALLPPWTSGAVVPEALFVSPLVRQHRRMDRALRMPAMVVFYAPWCRHSKGFQDVYVAAAERLKDAYDVGAVNDEKLQLADWPPVHAYPTVRFMPGLPDDTRVFTYVGPDSAEELERAGRCVHRAHAQGRVRDGPLCANVELTHLPVVHLPAVHLPATHTADSL